MDKIKFMKQQLEALNLPYSLIEWNGDLPKTYWIGEFQEIPTFLENGYSETNFILTGTTRETWYKLYEALDLIKEQFPSEYGLRGNTANGAIIVNYESSFPIPTSEADIKRIQINIKIQEYKKG